MREIDLGERILAERGFIAMLEGDRTRPLTVPEWGRIHGAAKRIERAARSLTLGTLALTYERVAFDYDRILTHLSEPSTVDQLADMHGIVPEATQGEGGSDYVEAVSRAIRIASASIPVVTRPDMLGSRNLRPSDMELGRFAGLLTVIENPMMLFPLIATNRLQRRQAVAAREVYPTTFLAIAEAIFDAATARRAEVKSWTPKWLQAIAIMLDVPDIGTGFAAALQSARQQVKTDEAARKTSQGSSKAAKMIAKPSDRNEMETTA